ncbi:MAG: heavy-metal-associated domain-containing protein [Gammaproteobacteria bacterium]|nr:heavy-metal-associated domain-containing protein [Gammaproteobacteria bacterium]
MNKTYIVEGMACDGCVRSVTNAIEEAVPGATVQVDLQAKRVSVTGIDEDNVVRKAVEQAGYSYVGPV